MRLCSLVVLAAACAACGSQPHAALRGPVSVRSHTITVGALSYTIPDDFAVASARVVDLGTESIVAVESVVDEDDLAWRILVVRDGALRDFGSAALGNTPTLPGDGTIRARDTNCGQVTDTVYRVTATKLEVTQHAEGAFDVEACSG